MKRTSFSLRSFLLHLYRRYEVVSDGQVLDNFNPAYLIVIAFILTLIFIGFVKG